MIRPFAAFRALIVALVLLLLSPARAGDASFPQTLSQTRLFRDVANLTPSEDLIPYSINVSFWSDGAEKQRWLRLPPGGKVGYSAHDQWSFPAGTLFVKHFERPSGHSVETRLLRLEGTNVVGASYRWRADHSDADLLATNLLASDWYFPSPEDCRTCHTPAAGFILGLNTRQMNRLGPGSSANQLAAWSKSGRFDRELAPAELTQADRLSTDDRISAVRAYLDVNCALCHRPGGTVSYLDARFASPVEHLIDAPVLFNQGIDNARVVSPGDPWRSILLLRLQTMDGLRMPPLAHQRVDTSAVRLFTDWISSLNGPEVVRPPHIEPPGGRFTGSATVRIQHDDPEALIRYTTNGAAPGKSSPVYSEPILLTEPATIRARAYKQNATRSITVQQTFLIEPGIKP